MRFIFRWFTLSFLVLSGLRHVVSRDSENRYYYHRFANMIRDFGKNVKLFSRKIAKSLKTDVILAKFAFFCQHFSAKNIKKVIFRDISTKFNKITKNVKLFSFFLQFARVFRAIEGNFTLFAIFCQVFLRKKWFSKNMTQIQRRFVQNI